MASWIKGRMCPSDERLDGKTVIITGANSGIGKETARELFARGARIVMACRNDARAAVAAEEIRNADKARSTDIVTKKLDLASINSIRKFAKDILTTEHNIDILINNAGVMICPRTLTEDGIELQFGVNHLGHFLLTNLLLHRIKASAPSRIVNVSSVAHKYGKINFNDIHMEHNYDPIKAYCQSKLANLLFSRELARRLEGTRVSVYALHPGVVHTEIWRHSHETMPAIIPWLVNKVGSYLMKNPVQGAQTTIYCAVAKELEFQSGFYYSECSMIEPASHAKDDMAAKKLWDISCGLVSIEDSVDGEEKLIDIE